MFIAAKLVQSIVYSNKGGLMAGIIVGGWDAKKGPQCYNIPLGGAMTQMPVAIGGSGSTYRPQLPLPLHTGQQKMPGKSPPYWRMENRRPASSFGHRGRKPPLPEPQKNLRVMSEL